MATVVIQKRKRKTHISYMVSYRDPFSGRKNYFRSFKRMKDAQKAANHLRGLIDSGKLSEIGENKVRLRLLTFAEISEMLKKDWNARLKDDELRQKTFSDYIYTLNLVSRRFGKGLLCELTEKDILAYRSKVAGDFSNITSNRHLFIIKQVFKKGVEVRAIIDDPAAPTGYLSEKGQQRNKFLLPAELDRLIKASRQGRSKFYLPSLIYLGAEHGASKQEALALKWSDIDFEYEGQGLIRLFRTKNMRERTEYLMPLSKGALLEWCDHIKLMRRRRKISTIKSNMVFCRLDGTSIKRFDKAWRTACNAAGLEDFHFHDLRHTFCSNLLLSGSDLKDVKEMIGHSDLSMTDRYSHLTHSHKRAQQNKLAEHYANGIHQSGSTAKEKREDLSEVDIR